MKGIRPDRTIKIGFGATKASLLLSVDPFADDLASLALDILTVEGVLVAPCTEPAGLVGVDATKKAGAMDDPLHDDARTAFLFQCGESPWFAVSLDKTGANIPVAECAQGWRYRMTFRLGVHEPMPIAIAPEPILRGIEANGYIIWRKGSIFGTSQ